MSEAAPLWRPSAARIADAQLTRFQQYLRSRQGLEFADYAALHRWSVNDPATFWSELAHFADVRWEGTAEPSLEHPALMPGARFFPQLRLNFAENLLQFRDEREALVFVNEHDSRRALTYRQLTDEVARIAQGLRDAGVVAGDRVAGFLPNLPEAVVAMLATTSLGAVWSSCSPDFGIPGVLDRFGQIRPKVLFTADGYVYAGKRLDSLAPIAGVLKALPSVEHVIVVPYLASAPDLARLDASAAAARAWHWASFGRAGAALQFARQAFNHPLYVLYSSGTTGAPKCIVHGAGGTLLQHRKEHLLHTDLKRSDRLFYFTTCGWMMWNWLVSGLATGATLVLFDGSPFHPDAGVLWRIAERERVTVFGTSAKYIATLEKSGYEPAAACNLPALRTLLSTGSPLAPESFDFVYRSIKTDLHLASISGGTDIVSCFMLGVPTLPVWRGEIQAPALGMSVEVFDDAGRRAPVGQKGELVCTKPFPSMPIGFWGDDDGQRYRAAYFERFPGIWHHGDYVSATEHGGFAIHGRSDAVLNPGGVRIGTAEIYRQVETLPEVLDSLCIGQDWQGDVRVVLFVKLRDGVQLDDVLQRRIRDTIRAQTTPRHVPAKILAVPDIPRTLSGKIVELAVRNVVHGRPVTNLDALANPQALEHFRNRRELLD
jgi:acetoacetyl-CoA synthetase